MSQKLLLIEDDPGYDELVRRIMGPYMAEIITAKTMGEVMNLVLAFGLPKMSAQGPTHSLSPLVDGTRSLALRWVRGIAVFLACAVQVYAGKLLRTGPATRGLYAVIRHPQ